MSMRDILTAARELLQRPGESGPWTRLLSRLDEVLAAVEAVQVADKITPAQALIRLEWRVALFPLELFAELGRSVRGAEAGSLRSLEAELRTALDALRAAAAAGETAAVFQARGSLAAIRARLETLSAQVQRGSLSSRLLRNSLVLSGLAAALSAAYLRSDLGLRLVRIEGLQPAVAYQALPTSDSELLPQPEYLDHFMAEFSKHYFGHPSHFSALYYDKPKDGKPTQRRTLLHKISLRNSSHGLVKYISSVDAVVQAEGEAEFPWRQLTVTAKVTAQPSTPAVPGVPLLKSEGIGPALDVRYSWRAQSGLLLSQDHIDVFLRSERLTHPQITVGQRGVAAGVLEAPLYYKLDAAPQPADPQRHLWVGPGMDRTGLSARCSPPPESRHGWYQIVRTPVVLRTVTAVGFDEPWTLEYRYRALNSTGDLVGTLAGRLSGDRAYFQRAPRLFESDPRCFDEHDSDGIADHVDGPPLEALAMIFADEKAVAQPKGVDLLTVRLGLDLYQVPAKSRLATAAELDGFLNPQGVLAVYLNLNMPDRLRYRVTVRVNGQPAASYRFAGLVPEFLTFEDEGETQAVGRLRQIFGVAQK